MGAVGEIGRHKMDKEKLLGLYPNYTSVLGPYMRSDGRKHVVLNNSNAPKGTKGKTKTISYPKALKEIELNKVIDKNHTVDHFDRDSTNDDVKNLIVYTRVDHAIKDAVHVFVEPVSCPICNKSFTPNRNQRNNITDKAGPFCGKVCAGKYGAMVQNQNIKIEKTEIKKFYYQKDK